MTFSQESLTLLLLCSSLALDDDSLKPLTGREWNSLARKLHAASLQLSDLPALSDSDLHSKLDLDQQLATRISSLLSRDIQPSLSRLASLGIFPLTRADSDYPKKYLLRLKDAAPPVLFYAGEKALLGQPGIAVVGSRHLDESGQACAEWVGNACGLSGMVLYSGGARGVDSISMAAALEARGTAVGVLADSLTRAVKAQQAALARGDLCLVTPYHPEAGFSVGAAMGRNRLIYCLADYAIVVAAEAETGGTWAGATEALKHGWLPLFVLEHPAMPAGNRRLLEKGALPFPHPFREAPTRLPDWLKEKAASRPSRLEQGRLF
jgi:predicted Rossmann fold nucleotide-binding protein DprA/Smf involved in DNA uptake